MLLWWRGEMLEIATAGCRLLHGRTRHSAIGAKDATISGLRPYPLPTMRADVKELASISGHRQFFFKATMRAGEERLKYYTHS
jgi:hypothetical protein